MTFAARSILPSGSVLNSTFSDSQFLAGVGATQALSGITFEDNGTVTGLNDANPNWFDPTTSGIGASYWVYVSPTIGTFTSGTTGSRLQLSTPRAYTCETTGGTITRVKSVTASYEIWNASTGGSIVGSGTITLQSEVDNT
jgi:hypothetical protein